MFTLSNEPDKAILAYQHANAWQEVFTVATTAQKSTEEIRDLAVEVAGEYCCYRCSGSPSLLLSPGLTELPKLVAERLTSKRRYAEAGRVLFEYGQDLPAAIDAICEGNLHAEAVRLVRFDLILSRSCTAESAHITCSQTALHNRRDLVESRIKPSTLEMQQRLFDDFSDATEQLEKQADRLDELKQRQISNPCEWDLYLDRSLAQSTHTLS